MSQSSFFSKAQFLDLEFDCATFDEMIAWLRGREPEDGFATIVTANVDHIVGLHREPRLRTPLYRDATICLCDSRILSRLARISRVNLSIVPGSDLVAALFARVVRAGDKVAIVGGGEREIQILRAKYPTVEILHHEPPMGLRNDAAARTKATIWMKSTSARFVLLAVGCPQQELLAWEAGRAKLSSGTILCIGASIDFLVGAQIRAPALIQRGGFEWAWRLANDPRRLARRYLWDGLQIFVILWRWRREG